MSDNYSISDVENEIARAAISNDRVTDTRTRTTNERVRATDDEPNESGPLGRATLGSGQ